MRLFQMLMLTLLGGALIWGSVTEVTGYLRSRSRLVRTTGVVIGVDEEETRPGVRRRSALFRFTTDDGETIETVSSAQTWPGPKVGALIPVTYDPEHPWEAERTGVLVFKLWMMPFTFALGVLFLVLTVRELL
ncbi:DUF3592 domain-containing protein [Streptomyces griseus]|uniref:DUF3592 domain-containing protein n=1 Tax=Streptomyces griseus TaxID=1911 RepID=UPI00131DD400|nr:DUF3592 domain-containing protein [Streptomyces griseus]